MNENTTATAFFETYRQALLDRDADAIASHYGVPALIVFPGQVIPVSNAAQTVEFFTNAVGQYDGVSDTDATVAVVAATDDSIWADVTWDHHGGAPDERMMYQLVRDGDEWKIAVLTPITSESGD